MSVPNTIRTTATITFAVSSEVVNREREGSAFAQEPYMRDPDTGQRRFHEGPPKTEASERLIHLPKDIIQVLCEHREQRQASSNYSDSFCQKHQNHDF